MVMVMEGDSDPGGGGALSWQGGAERPLKARVSNLRLQDPVRRSVGKWTRHHGGGGGVHFLPVPLNQVHPMPEEKPVKLVRWRVPVGVPANGASVSFTSLSRNPSQRSEWEPAPVWISRGQMAIPRPPPHPHPHPHLSAPSLTSS